MLLIKPLDHTPVFQIVNCFNLAFADYFVPFHVSEAYMKERWRGSRVNFSLSFGAFDKNKLVGFIITGVDQWYGKQTAYNAGTGVIPSYRGQKIVAKLYEQLIPALRANGIQHSVLEVICENEKAIRTYQNAGFEIIRRLHCVGGKISTSIELGKGIEIRREPLPDWEAYAKLPSYPACWDNHKNAIVIQQDNFEFLTLYRQEELLAYLIWKPEKSYIAQFAHQKLKYGLQLFSQIKKQSPSIKINNIDANDKGNLELIETIGLQKVVDQWEMSAEWL